MTEKTRLGFDAAGDTVAPAAPAEAVAMGATMAAGDTPIPDGAALGTAPAAFKRGDSIGPFLVVDVLGAGGMGAVFSAYDPQLDRRVAIKVVHPGLSQAGTVGAIKSRLLREAQAMAKLSHPNVITVYEVGALGEDIYVAMEFVDGGTLAGWLRDARRDHRPWRDLVAKVVLAGRGLAAAHHAGLVHRDFKPDNVLVGAGANGVVRVTDFGLVGTAVEDDEPAAMAAVSLAMPTAGTAPGTGIGTGTGIGSGSGSGSGSTRGSAPSWSSSASARDSAQSLTRTGTVMGTPAYMAPEQYQGKRVDARADQFAFAVTLYEALTGERPFTGASYGELMARVCEGRVKPFSKRSRVPAVIRAAILRALSVEPSARFASMDELLAVLERDPHQRARRIAIGGGAGAVVAGVAIAAALGAFSRDAAEPCAGSRERLAGAWDPETRARVEQAFVAAAGDHGAASFVLVAGSLDAYAERWAVGHRDACEANVVRHDQSDHLFDLRGRCLERRRAELASLSALLVAADAEIVAKSTQAAYALAAPERCADVDSLGAAYPPPERADVAAAVDALRHREADIAALQATGKWKDATGLATALVADARKVDYPPTLAEALYLAGTLRRDLKDGKAAEALLVEDTLVAARAKDDVLLAHAWTELVFSVGFLQARPADGLVFEAPARSMVERASADAQVRARLDDVAGLVLVKAGRLAEAKPILERARVLQVKELGAEHPDVATTDNNLALLAKQDGRLADAKALYTRAFTLRTKVLGPDHPLTLSAMTNIATVTTSSEAVDLDERALAIQLRVLGPNAQEVGLTMSNLASNYQGVGNYDKQLELAQKALPIKLATSGPDNPSTAYTYNAIGGALINLGRCDDAMPQFQHAIAIFEKAGADLFMVVEIEDNVVYCLVKGKRLDDARAAAAHAVEVGGKLGATSTPFAKALMARARVEIADGHRDDAAKTYVRALAIRDATAPDSADSAYTLRELGRTYLDDNQPALAIPVLERGAALNAKLGDKIDEAWCSYNLAIALWATDTSAAGRARARALATRARDLYTLPRDVDEVTRWLAAHP